MPWASQWHDNGHYFPGKIFECSSTGVYTIKYDDKEVEQGVPIGRLKRRSIQGLFESETHAADAAAPPPVAPSRSCEAALALVGRLLALVLALGDGYFVYAARMIQPTTLLLSRHTTARNHTPPIIATRHRHSSPPLITTTHHRHSSSPLITATRRLTSLRASQRRCPARLRDRVPYHR